MRRAAYSFVLAGIVVLVIAGIGGVEARATAYTLLGLATFAATIIGARRHKPGTAKPWYLLSAGVLAFVVGGVVRSIHGSMIGVENPFPSPADIATVMAYVFLVLGLRDLLRSRSFRADITTTLDAFLIAGGVGTIVWIYLIGPHLADASIPLTERLLNAAYSAFTILVAAMIARVALTPGNRPTSYKWLAIGGGTVLLADILVTMSTAGLLSTDYLAIAGAVPFVILGGAALHPSMVEVTARTAVVVTKLTALRLSAMAGAVLLPPVLLLVEDLRGGVAALPVVVTAWALLTVIGVIRLGELIWSRQRLVSRQAILLEAGQDLVSATEVQDIHETVVRTGMQLAGHLDHARVSFATGPPEHLIVVASAGHRSEESLGCEVIDAEWRKELREGGIGGAPIVIPSTDAPDVASAAPVEWLVVAPIAAPSQELGCIFVSSFEVPDELLLEGLALLTTDLALALDAAALTEEIHRQRSQRRFQALVENSTDMVVVLDADSAPTFASPSAHRKLPLSINEDDQPGDRLIDLVDRDDRATLQSLLNTARGAPGAVGPAELRFTDHTGQPLWLEVVLTDLTDEPEVGGIVLNAHDLTARKALEESLRHQALHDSLTGLANRFLFQQRVNHAIVRRSKLQDVVGVLFIDLDDFKTVNDSLGHAVGDKLLKLVADRLTGTLHSADTAARLGGDEFAVLLENSNSKSDAITTAETILTQLNEPFMIDGRVIDTGATIGVCFADDNTNDAELVLRNADVAMYAAKHSHKGSYCVFEQEMHATIFERMELRADLASALRRGELSLVYQPIVSLTSTRLAGFEALMRWHHPTRGFISPVVFIPIAEQSGLIGAMGDWLVVEASRQMREWQQRHDPSGQLFMSINASVEQLQRPEFVEHVRQTLRDAELNPECLTI
ncbi:MAG: diguanylate cyclase, partial [Actinomycetota bacterium]|nr:diguanylate cyclase [Actinomycetota bacterium]